MQCNHYLFIYVTFENVICIPKYTNPFDLLSRNIVNCHFWAKKEYFPKLLFILEIQNRYTTW